MPSKHSCGMARGWPPRSLDTGAPRRMPTLDLHQRRAVVTGAAKGIGRAIATRLLTAGAAVCLWDRDPEGLTSTAHDLAALGTVEAVTVDVTDPAAVSAAVQVTRERFGGIGILVNCVTPAAVETDLFQQMTPAHIEYMRSRIPMGRFGQPTEIAALVAWLASEECSFSTGGVFDISGGRATY